jgi:hypothetical protein
MKKVWEPKIILLRKYNMILNVKDAGVNRKRKPSFVLYIIVVCMAKTKTNKATKRLQHQNRKTYHETIVEEIRLYSSLR